MPGPRIPVVVKTQVAARIAAFSRQILRDPLLAYRPRYQGAFLYLDRDDYGHFTRICRLRYTGALERWEFAIYRHSDERYDPHEWFFPGAGLVDGTIEGAMRAGMAAYPP
jgi:hypothetical protein